MTSDVPLACDACYDENVYVRMISIPQGKECPICEEPFTVFKWRNPGKQKKLLTTQVCKPCAKSRNLCQVCLLDLQYHLPAQVRDTFAGSQTDRPDAKKVQLLEYLGNKSGREETTLADWKGGKYSADPRLEFVKARRPDYAQTKNKVCRFWLKGECTRGEYCPFRHERDVLESTMTTLQIQNKFYGVNDPDAVPIMEEIQSQGIKIRKKSKDTEKT